VHAAPKRRTTASKTREEQRCELLLDKAFGRTRDRAPAGERLPSACRPMAAGSSASRSGSCDRRPGSVGCHGATHGASTRRLRRRSGRSDVRLVRDAEEVLACAVATDDLVLDLKAQVVAQHAVEGLTQLVRVGHDASGCRDRRRERHDVRDCSLERHASFGFGSTDRALGVASMSVASATGAAADTRATSRL
jgi:hypothetical protein